MEEEQLEIENGIEVYTEGERLNELPGGCNIFYGSYIDNYNGNRRIRYYIDDYGQLIETNRTTSNRPSGTVCMPSNYVLPNYHNDIMRCVCFFICALVLVVGGKIVIGRLIK